MIRSRSSLHRELPRHARVLWLGLALLSVLDVAITFYFGFRSAWGWCLVLHLLLCAVYYALVYGMARWREPDRASLLWITTAGLLIPCVGLLCATIVLSTLLLARYHTDFYKEYEDYVYYVPDSLETYHVNVEKDLSLLPFREVMMSGQHKRKKEALFTLLQYEGRNKVSLFQEALLDHDPEVVHYAATSLNYFNEQFVRSIKQLTAQLQQNERHLPHWRELFHAYEDYLSANLLSAELATEVNRTLRQLIHRGMELFPEELLFKAELCRLALREGETSLADRLSEELLAAPGYRHIGFLTRAERLYHQGRYAELSRLAEAWLHSGEPVPEDYLASIQLWKELNERIVPQTEPLSVRYR
jgi:hypothetical protein